MFPFILKLLFNLQNILNANTPPIQVCTGTQPPCTNAEKYVRHTHECVRAVVMYFGVLKLIFLVSFITIQYYRNRSELWMNR